VNKNEGNWVFSVDSILITLNHGMRHFSDLLISFSVRLVIPVVLYSFISY
jgi:hypothetical protein